ncbi:MAG: hypothetical protein ACK4ME_02835, partial [Fimbriimonadales bacterium]
GWVVDWGFGVAADFSNTLRGGMHRGYCIVYNRCVNEFMAQNTQVLGRIPTRQEVMQLGKYPIELYDQYFISWGEACAAARTTGMSELPLEARRSQQSSLFSEELFSG